MGKAVHRTALVYTMQAMLGYEDDYEDLKEFQQICLKGFERVARAHSLEELTKYDAHARRKYNYPYIEAEDYFPDAYTLAMLAYTKKLVDRGKYVSPVLHWSDRSGLFTLIGSTRLLIDVP